MTQLITCYEEVPKHLKHYWRIRHKLFSKFDDGIWVNSQALYSVTPESVARQIAQHFIQCIITKYKGRKHATKKILIVDPFAGVGGNFIQFLLAIGEANARYNLNITLVGVEVDESSYAALIHNIQLYTQNNPYKDYFIYHDDFFHMDPELIHQDEYQQEDIYMFLSPPWGGPQYSEKRIFDLQRDMIPYNLDFIISTTRRLFTSNLALYLPRNSDLKQLVQIQEISDPNKILVDYLFNNGKCRALIAYLQDLALPC